MLFSKTKKQRVICYKLYGIYGIYILICWVALNVANNIGRRAGT